MPRRNAARGLRWSGPIPGRVATAFRRGHAARTRKPCRHAIREDRSETTAAEDAGTIDVGVRPGVVAAIPSLARADMAVPIAMPGPVRRRRRWQRAPLRVPDAEIRADRSGAEDRTVRRRSWRTLARSGPGRGRTLSGTGTGRRWTLRGAGAGPRRRTILRRRGGWRNKERRTEDGDDQLFHGGYSTARDNGPADKTSGT